MPSSLDSEEAPFLQPSDPSDQPKQHDDEQDSDHGHRRKSIPPVVVSQKLRLRLLVTLFAIVLAVELSLGMTDAPLVRIYESITCRKYFLQHDPGKVGPDGQVDEEFCKLKEVQSEVAAVKGYMEFFEGFLSRFVRPGE